MRMRQQAATPRKRPGKPGIRRRTSARARAAGLEVGLLGRGGDLSRIWAAGPTPPGGCTSRPNGSARRPARPGRGHGRRRAGRSVAHGPVRRHDWDQAVRVGEAGRTGPAGAAGTTGRGCGAARLGRQARLRHVPRPGAAGRPVHLRPAQAGDAVVEVGENVIGDLRSILEEALSGSRPRSSARPGGADGPVLVRTAPPARPGTRVTARRPAIREPSPPASSEEPRGPGHGTRSRPVGRDARG